MPILDTIPERLNRQVRFGNTLPHPPTHIVLQVLHALIQLILAAHSCPGCAPSRPALPYAYVVCTSSRGLQHKGG
ncbi:hypothetical protein FIBSPDRAFT_859380 [Athelia psychrophila]|uniref:Uncharacterized protein n=1 Tax=Athelia psychrophila TaxID=1759441 RepID=A0A167U2T7_9AGAM|nr:hypothetical protein FIBSPDRAFT_879372 [Fibularhizoctonia sp. CBS 109695]KZP22616.1 hypothetical protein FIBSPDRAFT_859380 [Fibularhizoctonia sp. CBS 109695]